MAENETAHAILAFVKQLAESDTVKSDLEIAQNRGWLDHAGKPTIDGLNLVAALASQQDTRSVFRNTY